jgi:hypothetical protein
MPKLVLCFFCAWMVGCGNGALSPDDEFLTQAIALTNLGKMEVRNSQGEVTSLSISVDVVNTAPVAIDGAFVMTWWLRQSGGDLLAKTTYRFGDRPFGVGERQRIHVILTFPARPDLAGVQDAVTFEFEKAKSAAAMAGAGVLVMSSGGPCRTWTYMRHERL